MAANICFEPRGDLPGVFADHPNSGVNGSLWTLPSEVFCYLVLSALGLFGMLPDRFIGSAIMIAIMVYALMMSSYLAIFGFAGAEPQLLPSCFAFGELLAVNKNAIHLRNNTMLGLVILCWMFRHSSLFQLPFCGLSYSSILLAASLMLVRAWLSGDYSYGV